MEILLGTLTVRPLYGMHPRLDILGPIEARFHHADRCIIGGVNEGTFPKIPESGPWLNRPMRQRLGLPPPESKIGSLSMDFAHCFCGPEVILTRSLKSGGAETIPSRFLSRLDAALEGSNLNMETQPSNWAKELDKPDWKDTIERPAPCPPIEARPKSLSITKIENWMRNPYSIYAQYILGLKPLDSLSTDKKQQQYGIAIHKALELFITENPNNTSLERLLELGEQALTDEGFTETEKIFYLPRFNEMAKFIIQQQQETKNEIKNSFPEERGAFTFEVDGNPFTLTGQADRIDLFKNGTARIVDYKTGSVPSMTDIEKGFSPQLPLEGLLLNKNGFECLTSPKELKLDYWKLASKTKNCKVTSIKVKERDVNTLIQEGFEGLQNLIRTFNRPEIPYEVNPISGKEPTYNNYEHLSRTAEWQNDDGESE
jgi:ATP-dependent helicase/nuclease subunit B